MATRVDVKAFTIQATGRIEQVLSDLEVSVAYDPNAPQDPIPTTIKTKALWDTGATKCVISKELVQALGLTPSGATKMNHAGGESTSLTYVVNFKMPHGVGFAGIIVTEFQAAPNSFGAIIGMDVICHGDFAITNVAGKTCVSFRTPSCEVVDYVREVNRATFAGTARNAPCPCGSNQKFKHCHGKYNELR
jgi:hypothetical protein